MTEREPVRALNPGLTAFVDRQEMQGSLWHGRILGITGVIATDTAKPPRATVEFKDVTDPSVRVNGRSVVLPLDVLRASGVDVQILTPSSEVIMDSRHSPPKIYAVPPQVEPDQPPEDPAVQPPANSWGATHVKIA